MTEWIPFALRSRVAERALNRCEYCLFPQSAAWLAFEMEHIIARKHGGEATWENLALACPDCNRFKGTDIGSLDPVTGRLVRFFDPRQDVWEENFAVDGGHLRPLTAEGRVTEKILRLNLPERVAERRRLIDVGEYP